MLRSIAILALCVLLQACAAPPPPGPNPLRNDANFSRVQAGMTADEVRSLIGAPDNTMPFPRSGTDSWGYFYFDQYGYYVEFSVTFSSDGRVLSKNYRRVGDGGSKGR